MPTEQEIIKYASGIDNYLSKNLREYISHCIMDSKDLSLDQKLEAWADVVNDLLDLKLDEFRNSEIPLEELKDEYFTQFNRHKVTLKLVKVAIETPELSNEEKWDVILSILERVAKDKSE